ncbi:MAG TPA: hypothetical protein VNH84_22450 [Candidatus Saccharimonadales bacterium]|nr:hypothetical protein [Candidatus Saccharimonadales bacterium]
MPLALCWLALPPTLCAQTYLVTDLGLPGELESQAMSLNASGTVAGYSLYSTGMTARAWMWTADGGRVELGGFGGLESRAYAVNDAGQITGYATDAGWRLRGGSVRMRPACAQGPIPALPIHRDATNLALVRNRAHPVRGKDRSPPSMTR